MSCCSFIFTPFKQKACLIIILIGSILHLGTITTGFVYFSRFDSMVSWYNHGAFLLVGSLYLFVASIVLLVNFGRQDGNKLCGEFSKVILGIFLFVWEFSVAVIIGLTASNVSIIYSEHSSTAFQVFHWYIICDTILTFIFKLVASLVIAYFYLKEFKNPDDFRGEESQDGEIEPNSNNQNVGDTNDKKENVSEVEDQINHVQKQLNNYPSLDQTGKIIAQDSTNRQ